MVADIDRVNADLKNNYGEAAIDFLVTIPRKILNKILCKKLSCVIINNVL